MHLNAVWAFRVSAGDSGQPNSPLPTPVPLSPRSRSGPIAPLSFVASKPGSLCCCVFPSSAHAGDVTETEGATGSMETVVIVAIGVLATIFLASFAALVVVCRQRYCRPRDLLQRYDSK